MWKCSDLYEVSKVISMLLWSCLMYSQIPLKEYGYRADKAQTYSSQIKSVRKTSDILVHVLMFADGTVTTMHRK